MLRREQLEQFYEDVRQLDLKFPVAAIANETGHSKANVSKYLSRKLEPSESFLNAFYDKFLKSGKNVSRETGIKPIGKALPDDYKDRAIFNLTESYSSLSRSYEELVQMVKGLTVNVGQGTQKVLAAEIGALQELLKVSLSRERIGACSSACGSCLPYGANVLLSLQR